MPSDSTEDRLSELLLRWRERREAGESVDLSELLSGDPGLIEELSRWIKALKGPDALPPAGETEATEGDTVVGSASPGPGPKRDGSGSATCQVVYGDFERYARDGFGEVFRARGDDFGREVTLKTLRLNFAEYPEYRRRFLIEAELTSRLEHPGVVPVYGLGTDDLGHPCYVMRLVRGGTLHQAIVDFHHDRPDDHPVEFRALLRRFMSTCETIAYAHSRGLIHRNIKPHNVILGDYGETLVIDWHLALDFKKGDDPDLADDPSYSAIVGTPAYMSPEQAAGHAADLGPASDIYSLGAMLYQILSRKIPHDGPIHKKLEMIREGKFPAPRTIRPTIPRPLEAICLKAMSLRPADRYASALDLAAAVELWIAGEPVLAFAEPWWTRLGRWMKRHGTAVAIASAVLATAFVAMAVGLFVVALT